MNRIEIAIKAIKTATAERLAAGKTTQQALDDLYSKLDFQMDEYRMLQNLKSLAPMTNDLTQEEAMTIYRYMGNSLSHFNQQPLEVKVALTQVYASLLKKHMDRQQKAS